MIRAGKANLLIRVDVFCAFYVAGMFYVFKSGLPQPSDFLGAALIAFNARLIFRTTSRIVAERIALCIAWICIVNLVTYYAHTDQKLLIVNAYYMFNFGVFLLSYALGMAYGPLLFDKLRLAVIASAVIQVVALLLIAGGLRKVGTFQNPNQLGYWAVLNIAMLGCCLGRRKMNGIEVATLFALLFATASSLSRAAIAAAFAGAVLMVWFQGMTRKIWYYTLVLATGALPVAIGGGYLSSFIDRLAVVDAWEQRMSDLAGRSFDEYSSRGFDRLSNNIESLVFGAGEGAYERFIDTGPALELHSTFASLLMSYGIVGIFVFALFIHRTFVGTMWRHVFYCAPIALYGITHNGIRFTWLWIILGIIAAQGAILGAQRARQAAHSAHERHLA